MIKYVIEFDKEQLLEYDKDTDTYFRTLYKAKGFNALVFDKQGLDKLTPLDKELEEAYQKGYDTGSHESTTLEYQRGLDDAWEIIIKIALIPYAVRSEIFDGQQDILSIVQKFSPSEVTAKLREHEQQKADEIKVGDEVRNTLGLMDNAVGFVIGTTIEGDYNVSRYIDGKIKTGTWRRENCVKTGKHSDAIVQLLAEMEGGAE